MLGVDVQGRPVLVVGGGPVAERKARTLFAAGATVRVISPLVTPGLQELSAAGSLEWLPRPYEPGDTAGAWLVVAATGEAAVDTAVADEAKAAGALVSVSGDPALGNVHFPAAVRRGPVTVGIATDGASPALARRLRQEVERVVGPEYGLLAELLAEARSRLGDKLTQAERAAIYEALVSGPALGLLAEGRLEEARALVHTITHSSM